MGNFYGKTKKTEDDSFIYKVIQLKDYLDRLVISDWNYEAKIIPRAKIAQTIKEEIINKAKRFICLISPFWTDSAAIRWNLEDQIKQKKDKVDIYLFARKKEAQFSNNRSLFRKFFFELGIKNCWLVKNLHSKIYYNENKIVLTSANITATSLSLRGYNIEDAVLMRLKDMTVKDSKSAASWRMYNLNPFAIPPFHYLTKESYPSKRFPLGYLYNNDCEIETPTVFSFNDMMQDWLLSVETVKSYQKNKSKRYSVAHLGELEGFCPICKEQSCDYARTFICPKYCIELSKFQKHCHSSISCEKGPHFQRSEFGMKCPITVFYCPSKDIYFDPSKNQFLDRGLLSEAKESPPHTYTSIRDSLNGVYSYLNKREKEEIDQILDIEARTHYYCRSCSGIIEEQDKHVRIETQEDTYYISFLRCQNCGGLTLRYCPICYSEFPDVNLKESYYHCTVKNRDFLQTVDDY